MKKWITHNTTEETYILLFSHHNLEEKQIVCLFRDPEGDWRTTADLLGTFWTYLTNATIPAHDAKIMVEEMVIEHYADEIKYHQEALNEFTKEMD